MSALGDEGITIVGDVGFRDKFFRSVVGDASIVIHGDTEVVIAQEING